MRSGCVSRSEVQRDLLRSADFSRFASEGLRFTQFYVNSPICSPSRVAITTGQYPQRWLCDAYDGKPPKKHDLGSSKLGQGPITCQDRSVITTSFVDAALSFIVRNATGNYGVSYRWNNAGTAATLVPAEGVDFPVNATQIWEIPSRAECSTCHSNLAGHALSFRTRQLNRPGTTAGNPGNFIQLLTDWINGELTARQSYQTWRESTFGNPPTGGTPDDDDDLDGRTNYQEFLAGTNPILADTPPALGMTSDLGSIDLSLPAIPGRSVFLETSEDLVGWGKWNALGNDGLPRDPASPAIFTIPTTGPQEFFRARIEER